MTNEQGAYGAKYGTRFHLSSAPMLAVSIANQLQVAVTELRSDGMPDLPLPIPVEDAFSIHLHLRETDKGSLWVRRQLVAEGKLSPGSACICDLEKPPVLYLPEPFDFLQFYIPRTALNEFCYDNRLEPIGNLGWGSKDADETLHSLGLALLPALKNPNSSSQLFVDQIGLAILAHAAHRYGRVLVKETSIRGGLAPWQIRRATEFLEANVRSNTSLYSVATECELSVSHFARAFRKTFGQPPYRWLIERRVDMAKKYLLHSDLPLADIALRCGFADQSALNKSFRRLLNQSPGEWRRSKKQRSLISGDEGNTQQELPTFDGFSLDASPHSKLRSDETG
jgi:AraC family transcriptional regulator